MDDLGFLDTKLLWFRICVLRLTISISPFSPCAPLLRQQGKNKIV